MYHLTYTVNYPNAEVNDRDGGFHELINEVANVVSTIIANNIAATSFVFIVTQTPSE